jgi:hypothetical protein
MSVDYDAERDRRRVRWREDGRQRTRPFRSYEEAIAFDAEMSEQPPAPAAVTKSLQTSGGDSCCSANTCWATR